MQHTVSSKTLIKASITASLVAIIAFVLFILPAEYNIDPTGIGKQLGVTKIAQASAQKPLKTSDSLQVGSDEFQTIEVTIPANRGVEYKFTRRASRRHNRLLRKLCNCQFKRNEGQLYRPIWGLTWLVLEKQLR